MSRFNRSIILIGCAGAISLPGGLEAQTDVELLGRMHGTRPPAAYYETLRRDPNAFQFKRGIWGQARLLRQRAEMLARPGFEPLRAEQRVGAGVSASQGAFAFPMVLGLFSDTPTTPFPLSEVQAEFWDGPNSHYKTIPDFYDEISSGMVALTGVTYPWVQTSLTQEAVTDDNNGFGSLARTPEFIIQIVQGHDDGSVDWGQFDNDGPDGVPNSGDDDGYVDILVVVHPTPGGECNSSNGDRIWSHRWDLESAAYWDILDAWAQPILMNQGLVTQTPAAGGGVIRILDYVIQPIYACNERDINHIGVFTHELGHGFGLPDLYCTLEDCAWAGIGNWGLMGTGSWGCSGNDASQPCHPSAWSKAVLGWVDVQTLDPGMDHGTLTLPPVESSQTVFRVDAGDGSNDYYLLENRQPIGFDQLIYEPGLLVWKIDGDLLSGPWYGVNTRRDRMGVWLQQADNLDQLASSHGGRGDEGDPFPGSFGNTEFHAGSSPASLSHLGAATGLTLLDIQEAGENIQFRALTRFQSLNLRTVGAPGSDGLVTVDGVTPAGREASLPSAPYDTHLIEASPGVEESLGYRVAFVGWEDGSTRVREYTTMLSDTTLTATYGGEEVLITMTLQSPVAGLVPGSVQYAPGSDEGWVPSNTDILVTAVPRTGFGFVEWTGPLAGHPNPTTTRWSAPSSAGAFFDITFSVAGNPESVQVEAATYALVSLSAENANYPVTWTLTAGTLPEGMSFVEQGQIVGASMETGSFPLSLEIVDAIGLSGEIDLELEVLSPQLSLETLAAPFLLKSSGLTLYQEDYLDRVGNANDGYDLGDLRAFVIANPGLPTSGPSQSVIQEIDLVVGVLDPAPSVDGKGGAR